MAAKSSEYWRQYRQRNAGRINAQQRDRYAARKRAVFSFGSEHQLIKPMTEGGHAHGQQRFIVVPLFPDDAVTTDVEKNVNLQTTPVFGGIQSTKGARRSGSLDETPATGEIAMNVVTQPISSDREVDKPWSMQIAQHFIAQPGKWAGCAVLLIFLFCNTAYLALEQRDVYLRLDYSPGLAMGIAILCDAAIEIQAFFLGALAWNWKNWLWKLALASSLSVSIYMVSGLVSDAGEHRVMAMASKAKPSTLLAAENRARLLALQFEQATTAISNYDPKTERTKLISAAEAINRRGGLSYQLNEANALIFREDLAFKESAAYQKLVDRAARQGDQRKLSLLWNVLLAQLLAFLIGRPATLRAESRRK